MARDVYTSKGQRRHPKQGTAYRGQRDYSILPRSPSEALEPERAPEPNLAHAIRRRFAPLGGVDLELPPPEFVGEPPSFAS